MQGYYLGLDLGTGSLGWAVTDENYQILRRHGKDLWGVRLFDNAKTAEERRIFRTNRRRLDRQKWRIDILQGIFGEEINKVDEGFFLRMKESKYYPDEKRDTNGNCPELPYALFVDPNFTDKEYHKQFPTIYHLRKYLMETKDTPDIRLVYLALHHFMKHRGHFLLSGSIDSVRDFKTVFKQFISAISDEEFDNFHLAVDDATLEEIEKILGNSGKTKSEKKSELISLLKAKTSQEKTFLTMITGLEVKLKDLFDETSFENVEKPKFRFSDSNYEENVGTLADEAGELFTLIELGKAVYDWSVLADILGKYDCISDAKIASYDKHSHDLALLKKSVREMENPEIYRRLFVETEGSLANYVAYVGMAKQSGKKVDIVSKRCKREDFYAFLKKEILPLIQDKATVEQIQKDIEQENFLPRQVVKDNSVIPYQVHLYELNQILCNLEDKIPLVRANKDYFLQLFQFRIPYYVGPLKGVTRNGKTTNWVQRNSDEKIYPWNFEQVVDLEESATRFIRRMTNKCTYLTKEDVLPKYSLLYSKFEVLNELNNVRLNGELLPVATKQFIYESLFQKTKKVTRKKFVDFLVREGIAAKTVEVTGVDGDFKGSLTAYHDLKQKLTGVTLSDEVKEKIILDITLFGEDKKLLKGRIKKLVPELTEKQVNDISNLNYSGWGRLSYQLLSGITAPNYETGEACTIIRTMWETTDNFMQILSSKYQFAEEIERVNGCEENSSITYAMVDELQLSPVVKRQVWQTILVVKELNKVMGGAPERVFVEMAREKQESKRTESRKKVLIDLYKKCGEEAHDFLQTLESTDEATLRRDKLYLYYTQMGRCMYTGERISLEDLWDNTKYDIDHIFPQSKVMDDSLTNRVLVKKVVNEEKSDKYPLPASVREKQQSFWKTLLLKGLIPQEKFSRLVRATGFEPDELAGFISRQLVETRQSTKAVASLLKQIMPDSEIIYVKAGTVSKFRQDFSFGKIREMNDLHHAKDAYLNIVVGNVYFTKFTQNAAWFIRENPGRSYNLNKMFIGSNVERNGKTAWKAGEGGTIATVRKVMGKNSILVTRRSYEVHGGLFDQQIMKKGKGQVPIKGTDDRLHNIERYGGYNKASGAYFMLVESTGKKGKKIRTIEFVPVYLAKEFESDSTKANAYLAEEIGLVEPRICIHKILKDTLFVVDGFAMTLSGRTGDRLVFCGANQLLLSEEEQIILKKVIKYVNRRKENKNATISQYDELTEDKLLLLYDAFVIKLTDTIYRVRLGAQITTLTQGREKFCALSLEEKCAGLYEILHLFQCQSGAANLTMIGGAAHAGILVLNNDISTQNSAYIVNQSVTGIFCKSIDLLTV
ncbi:MAG: type II CRISPR RNA-guided endonuclease Cas9 [Acetatifactor sp.]